MSEPITHCRVCNTHWSDCDVLAEEACAACLAAHANKLDTKIGHLEADLRELRDENNWLRRKVAVYEGTERKTPEQKAKDWRDYIERKCFE